MALKIVWRNPNPSRKAERQVEPLAVDEFGSV